jgi:protein-tyrosine phosphatase
MDPGARAELAARGYDGSGHRARQFDRSWFGDYDLVVAMDRQNLADLSRMAPDLATARDRIRLLRSFDPRLAGDGAGDVAGDVGAGGLPGDPFDGDVPDPYHGDAAEYALAFDLVQAAARGLAAQLATLIGEGAGGRRAAGRDGDGPGGGGPGGGGRPGRVGGGGPGRVGGGSSGER